MKEYFKVNKFSASAAKILAGGLSPYAAFHKLRAGFKATDAMKLGTIMHSIIEHGGKLPASVAVVSPYLDYKSGEAQAFKAWWGGAEDFLSKLPKKVSDASYANLELNIQACQLCKIDGGILTDQPTIDKAHKMAEAIMNATDTVAGEHEKAIYTEESKCLMDFVNEDTVKDWKSTAATKMSDVLRDCWKFGYHIQAAHYLAMSGKDKFEFDFVSSVEPHETFIVECGESFLETGREQLAYAKDLWDQYKDTPLEEIPKAEIVTIEDKYREDSEPVFETEGEF
tara:strand:- start:1072 stop:1920 length:849 start_codon:yes stop_codon:yes gene_type:complete